MLICVVLAGAATAQEPVAATYNGTTISVGGGVQLLQLPDIRYTFLSSTRDGAALRTQKNDDFDDYGGVVSGVIETPLGFWGTTPVTGVVSGFFANVEDGDRHSCVSRGNAICTAEDIVDSPNRPDSLVANRFVTKTDRDVDFWGAGAEARIGKVSGPILPRDAGATSSAWLMSASAPTCAASTRTYVWGSMLRAHPPTGGEAERDARHDLLGRLSLRRRRVQHPRLFRHRQRLGLAVAPVAARRHL